MRGLLAAQLEEPLTLKRLPRNDVDFKHEIYEISEAVIGPDPSEAETTYLGDLWSRLNLVSRDEAARQVQQTRNQRARNAV